jgi:hypothetical protein
MLETVSGVGFGAVGCPAAEVPDLEKLDCLFQGQGGLVGDSGVYKFRCLG